MTEIKNVRSVCPYDCPDTCGLLVRVEGDRAVSVAGDPDHPFTRGFLCAKMNRYEETVHSPRRLTTPLVRSGPKGSGEFSPFSWEEAIGVITEKWQALIEQFGSETILPYSYAGTMGLVQRNAGHPFFHRLGASRLDRTICSPAKDAGIKSVLGDTPAPHPDEVADSDLAILWGINAAATNVHFLPPLRTARERGARVWMIDTYETPTAAVADDLFLIRPGSDGALALGMMHVIVREGLANLEFIRQHVQGFEELTTQILPDYPPARAAELTGLAPEKIEEMARAYARAERPFIRLGSGLSRYGNGSMTVRTIACLPALTGAHGKRGAGLFGGTSTGGAFAMNKVVHEDFMPRPTRIVNMNRLGHALNELDDPRVMSLYVYHSNPAAITPDQNAVIRGLARDDLFTVVHERFLTDTARYADIVLPATSSLETSDLYRSYGTYCIQRARPAIPPVGESKSNWEVFSLLAQGMGFTEPLFDMSAEALIDRLLEIPSPLRAEIDTEALAEGKAVELSVDLSRSAYATPSGKIEILNPREAEPLPRFLDTHEEKGKYPFRLMTAPNLYSLNASFYERDDLREKQQGMKLLMNSSDATERGVESGDMVTAWNDLGEVDFVVEATQRVPRGVVAAEGVWWLEFAPGKRSVNALTSQRLTDKGNGSTFYDNRVDVRRAKG